MATFIPEFDSSDWELIRAMVRDFKQKRYNQVGPSLSPGMRFTPDTFIALTPTGGIPSRDGFVPGKATCQVYRIVDINGVGTLQVVTDLTRVVYNNSTQAIDGGQFIKIQSDKWGRWLPDGCNICYYDDTGTGTGIPIDIPGTGTGTGTTGGGTISTPCCSGRLLPATLYGIFSDIASCSCLSGELITLTYQTVSSFCGFTPGTYTGWLGTNSDVCTGKTIQILLTPCTTEGCGGIGGFKANGCCGTGDLNGGSFANAGTCVCDPLYLEFDLVTFGSNCGCSQFRLTVTETPP